MISLQLSALRPSAGDLLFREESPDSPDLPPYRGSSRVPLVLGLKGSSALRSLPEDLASRRGLPSMLLLPTTLADTGTRPTRTSDAVDVGTLADVAKPRRHLSALS